MAQLRAALDAAGAGRGSMVLLTGPAGIGKSRLAGELAADAEARGLAAALGRATLASAATAFGPLTQALLQLLRGRSLPADDDFRQWRAVLASIIPTFAADAERRAQSAAVQAEAVVQLLGRLTGEVGAVLVLEDLHWADPDTLRLLEYLADAVGAQPVVWIQAPTIRPPTAPPRGR